RRAAGAVDDQPAGRGGAALRTRADDVYLADGRLRQSVGGGEDEVTRFEAEQVGALGVEQPTRGGQQSAQRELDARHVRQAGERRLEVGRNVDRVAHRGRGALAPWRKSTKR